MIIIWTAHFPSKINSNSFWVSCLQNTHCMCCHIVDCTFFFIFVCLFFFWLIIASINPLKYIIVVSLFSSIDLGAWGVGGLGLGLGRVGICLNCSQCQPSWQLFLIWAGILHQPIGLSQRPYQESWCSCWLIIRPVAWKGYGSNSPWVNNNSPIV